MAISPCKNLCGKVDQLDKLEDELGQLSQVGHAKNHSALSALFALLQVKVQKVQIVQCKKMHEILETIETVRKKVSQESQLSHAKIYTENCEKSENSHFSQCKIYLIIFPWVLKMCELERGCLPDIPETPDRYAHLG